MSAKKITLLIGLFSTSLGFCQQSPVACGGNAISEEGTVSYSLGQISYESQQSENTVITQGVQQPYEILTLDTGEVQMGTDFKVYPNPSAGIFNLNMENQDLSGINYNLIDITGKNIISNKPVSDNITQINIQNLQSGTYVLSISKDNSFIKSYKIIKR